MHQSQTQILPGSDPREIWDRAIDRPYALGVDDCCTVPADVLKPVWGVDLMANFRGRYKSLIGFRRVLKNDGFDSLSDAVEQAALIAGAVVVDPSDPKDFDLGLIQYKTDRLHALPAFFCDGLWNGYFYERALGLTQAVEAWRLSD